MGLVNDGGSWVGSNRGFLTFASDGPPTVHFLGALVGEGGHDRLSMFFAETGDVENVRWLGVIVPTADIPSVPGLPAEQDHRAASAGCGLRVGGESL